MIFIACASSLFLPSLTLSPKSRLWNFVILIMNPLGSTKLISVAQIKEKITKFKHLLTVQDRASEASWKMFALATPMPHTTPLISPLHIARFPISTLHMVFSTTSLRKKYSGDGTGFLWEGRRERFASQMLDLHSHCFNHVQ